MRKKQYSAGWNDSDIIARTPDAGTADNIERCPARMCPARCGPACARRLSAAPRSRKFASMNAPIPNIRNPHGR
jgi:hypothetical protein